MNEAAYFFVSKFHFTSAFASQVTLKKLDAALREARMDFSAAEFFSLSFGVAATAALLFMTVAWVLDAKLLALSPMVFALTAYATLKFPERLLSRKIAVLERELPAFLRIVVLRLRAGSSVEDALFMPSRSFPGIYARLKAVKSNIDNGMGFEKSIAQNFMKLESLPVKQSFSYLIETYKRGSGVDVLQRAAGEQARVHLMKLKKYNSKIVLYSLVLVAMSSVVPALFEAFAIIGSIFLEVSIAPQELFWIVALGFPLINSIIVLVMIVKRPV